MKFYILLLDSIKKLFIFNYTKKINFVFLSLFSNQIIFIIQIEHYKNYLRTKDEKFVYKH